ncbi:hypothetical protein [Natronolimnobius baerhuensis]|uniref:Uncharacterized protein n=1 Tax=Natronolimnobius baerhuensis TaxID=253108 RepID=A0A202E6M1_9EURY|nr:hypothetical protein [Natronolimnobius baerhuensis]OVE83913.1 hypothetical protein B2G88_16005 [Natronolimnobius baerhuensis]
MTLDRHAAERRRFARLLGVDGELGSGLPVTASEGDRQHGSRDHGSSPRSDSTTTTPATDALPTDTECPETDLDPDETQSLGAD